MSYKVISVIKDGKVFIFSNEDGMIRNINEEVEPILRNMWDSYQKVDEKDKDTSVLYDYRFPILHVVDRAKDFITENILEPDMEIEVYELQEGVYGLLCTGEGALEWHCNGIQPKEYLNEEDK